MTHCTWHGIPVYYLSGYALPKGSQELADALSHPLHHYPEGVSSDRVVVVITFLVAGPYVKIGNLTYPPMGQAIIPWRELVSQVKATTEGFLLSW